jgi:glycosyltransferase involved in cell wall biosynthesis
LDKISVIIPTFNRSSSVKVAINSVLKQSYKNLEVIVVDDNGLGSEESLLTKEAMQELLINDKRVKYIELEKNSGGSIARNAGLAVSSGKYISFLDDDDEYYSNKLEKQLEFYKTVFPKNNGFINCQMEVFSGNRLVRTVKTEADESNLLFSAVSEKILGTPSLFLPRDLIFSVNLFTDRIKGQEWDLIVKLVDKGYGFKHMAEKLVRINISENSITSEGNVDRKVKGIENIYLNQRSYFAIFSTKEIEEINHSHYLKLSDAYLAENFIKSLKYYIEAVKNVFFSVENLKYPVKLLIIKMHLLGIKKLIRG